MRPGLLPTTAIVIVAATASVVGSATLSRAATGELRLGSVSEASVAQDALPRLRTLAEAGRPEAVVTLAKHLLSAGGADDVEEGLALLAPLAEAGDAGALETLGRFRLAGAPGHPADGAAARDLLTRAAAAGSSGAGVRLGEALIRGEAGEHDPAAGLAMLEALVTSGNPWAPTSLGKLLLTGAPGLDADVDRALVLLQGPASEGNVSALEVLGRFYLTGALGYPADGYRARAYLERAMAAGSASAGLHLARALVRGDAGLSDFSAGLGMLETDAALGDHRAAVTLGILYLNGGPDLAADPVRAVRLLQPAAEDGDPEALDALGRLYLTGGAGVAADPDRGRNLLERAAGAGRTAASLRLADALIKGEGGMLEPEAGIDLLEREVEAGDSRAMIMLAEALLRGAPGIERDGERARALMEAAIAAGDRRAPVRLAQLLIRGGAMARDPGTAERLLVEAADAGDMRAAVTLGNVYLFGAPGIARKPDRALAYLEKAAQAGDASAFTLIGRGHVLGRFGRPDAEKAMAAFERARGMGDRRAVVLMAETRIFGWGNSRKRPDEGFALLETDAASGNPEALRSLISFARDGLPKVRRPDRKVVEELIARYEAVAGREAALAERLLADAATARAPEAFAKVRDMLKTLPLDRQVAAANQILSINENVAVYLMQDALLSSGQFNGRATGRLDRTTVRAIMSACRKAVGRDECRAPLTPPVLQAVFRLGWTG